MFTKTGIYDTIPLTSHERCVTMEFHEKLQELRKQRKLTQEELAEALFVSRTAISKWESGRGYPNIDSLKAIAKFFSVTIDELLSGEEVLTIAEEDRKQKEGHFRDLVFGLLDFSVAMLFFLPLFGQRTADAIQEVPLLSLSGIAPYLSIAFFASVIAISATGILTLALQNCQSHFWSKAKLPLSMGLNAAALLLFIASLQPYAAILLFVFLAIKVLVLAKKQ